MKRAFDAAGGDLQHHLAPTQIEGGQGDLRRRATPQLRAVQHAVQRPGARGRHACRADLRRQLDPHLVAAPRPRPLHRGRHLRAMRVTHRLAVHVHHELRDARVHLHRPDGHAIRRQRVARHEVHIADDARALERIQRGRAAALPTIDTGLEAPARPGHVDLRRQVLLKEVVHQAVGREQPRHVVGGHVARRAAGKRIAPRHRLAAEHADGGGHRLAHACARHIGHFA
ncbi:hypothetical protein D3C71_1284000 [compost metagenome]